MKIIFLDIDGVLNCRDTPNPRKFPYVVDSKLLARLRQLLKRSGAKAVLTSTWRYDPVGLLAARYYQVPFIDSIPDMSGRPRREEILCWLAKHPRVNRYAVIDDNDDELDEMPLFQTKSQGLTPDIARAVGDFLLGKRKKDMRLNAVVRVFQNMRAVLKGHEG